MKFILVDSFDLVWNGKTARYDEGVSGSHNAPMYLAEALAKDHVVELVSTKNNIIEGTHLNVKYTNFNNFERTSCDYIVSTNFMTTLDILDKITSYNKILILTHNELVHFGKMLNIPTDKIIICYISEFAKRNILSLQPFLNNYKSMLLYNSIDLNDMPAFNVNEKGNNLCYFACIERGYKLTVEILKKLNQSDNKYTLYTNTYYEPYRHLMNQNNDSVVIVENSAKYTIFDYLKKSKYFVYPLINLDTGIVHYDTFGYVVLEALLMGVVVIAPKIGVYEELYGDAVCYIETDDIIPKEDLLNWKNNPYYKINRNFGYPVMDRYIEKIKLLDNDEKLRNSYIEKGLALKEKFSHINIGNQLLSFLSQFDKKTIPYKIHEITSNLTSNPTKLNQENQTFFFQDDEVKLKNHLSSLSNLKNFPVGHTNYLYNLKKNGFEPKVIYDIGSCVLHWTNEAKKYWPNATYILFDAFDPVEFLYKGYDYHIGVLSDSEKTVKFYENEYYPAGNSYYREIALDNGKYFPENKFVEKKTRTLDDIVKERGFPLPDFVKIDVQGSEVDVITGGMNTFKSASKVIVELQHTEYNKGALLSDVSCPLIENILNMKCTDPLFTNNGCDGDYCFTRV